MTWAGVRVVLAVMLGGAVGGVARFTLSSLFVTSTGWPPFFATNGINLLGACLLGLGATAWSSGSRPGVGEPLRQGVLVGALGSFTSLSLLSTDTLHMIEQGQLSLAWVNGLGSLGLAVAGAGLGASLGRRWGKSTSP